MQLRRFERGTLKNDFRAINWNPSGRVTDVVGTVVEARLPGSRLGTIVNIEVRGQADVMAEVVGFRDDKALLIPYASLAGIAPGCAVTGQRTWDRVPVGDFLLGKVVDATMTPLMGELTFPDRAPLYPLEREAPNPMHRARVETTMTMGIRAIDSMLSFGEGQRVGIMAGSGVGKSVLMGMIARGSGADVNVIGLIGERGREVREFIERDLGPEGLARSVVICSTGDQSPLMRIRAAKATTAIAEGFSAQGKRVLLMMDSLTRVAMAQREIGLSVQEPPTRGGYTPSVFSMLPRLLERSGPQPEGYGPITGLYTVLVDGDDFNEPIADAARSILDGHINLSRQLASRGHFPAIDVATSLSRVMHDIVPKDHWEMAQTIRRLLGVYQENIDYVQLGGYQAGTNPTLDAALSLMPAIEKYLRQGITERSSMQSALAGMQSIFNGPGNGSDER